MRPETQYVKNGDLYIAYQAAGEGPDVLVVPSWYTAVDAQWDVPTFAQFQSEVSSFARLIMFDQPGSGGSDPVRIDALPALESWMDNVTAVLDEVGSEATTLVAADSAGLLAIPFAATHPERVTGLILFNAFARFLRNEDYPWGLPIELRDKFLDATQDFWGSDGDLAVWSPSLAKDEQYRKAMARYRRMALSPSTARAMFGLILDTDVRKVLPVVRVPTVVLHSKGDRWVPIGHGRYLAQHIPGARLIEMDSDDHWGPVPTETMLRELRSFVPGARQPLETDRVLATLLYTDIVASTKRAAELGDARWRELLDHHDELVRRNLERFRGREVKTTGDGFLAMFDGPARAIRCATAIRDEAVGLGLDIRAGLHTGECELRGEDLGGIAVHTAARVAAKAGAREVLVSSTVKDLVAGSGIEFTDRSSHVLKGVPGRWRLFAVS